MTAAETPLVQELRAYLMIGCQRNAGGLCSLRKCLIRGGWKPGEKGDYSLATCPESEASDLLGEMLTALQEAVSFQNEDAECLLGEPDDGLGEQCIDGRCRDHGCMVARVNRWRGVLAHAEGCQP